MTNALSSFDETRLQQVESELKNRLRQQAALADLGQRALSAQDLDTLLSETAELVRTVLEADYSKILELLPGEQHLLLRAGSGWKQGLVGKTLLPAGAGSQSGYILQQDEPVIVRDLPRDHRFTGPQLLLDHQVVSGISVIIRGVPQPFGVLGVHTRSYREFTSDDAHFLQAVANVLASTIQRFRTEQELRYSRDELSVILQGLAEGVFVQEPGGRLVYANDAAAQALGYPSAAELLAAPREQVLARFDLYDESGRPFPLEKLPGRVALQEGRSSSVTLRIYDRARGQERWSLLRATPVLEPGGRTRLAITSFKDITEIKRIELAQRLLAEAGSLLSSSLDDTQTLANVARLAVPQFADWCSIHIVDEGQRVRSLVTAHADPQKVALLNEIESRYPAGPEAQMGVVRVLRTGKPEFYPEITLDLLKSTARDAQHFDMLSQLGLTSAIILPLVARGRTLGSLLLMWAESGHHYTQDDVALAEEIARRAALAIDNARLFKEVQAAKEELETAVARRTAQLQTLVTKLRSEINERKKAQEATRNSETLLERIFESAPDASVILNAKGEIVRVNQQVETLFGYTKEELVGQSLEILLPERYRTLHIRHREIYFRDLRTRLMGAGLDLYGRHKDGTEILVDIMLSPVKTEEGTLVISAIRDVTDRKRMEAELEELHRRLIDSLETERLLIAQDLHDGPIQDLYSLQYQLNAIAQDEEAAKLTRQDLSSLNALVQQVVSQLREICGELRPPALAPFGLEKAIRAHMESIAAAHPDLKVILDLMPDGQMLPERIRLGLFRIFQHAISNVIRHAQASSVIVQLKIDENELRLVIQDDGCGFELPARWIDLARKGHLGLVGTIERADAIGGRISIESSPGEGTRVEIILPLPVGSDSP